MQRLGDRLRDERGATAVLVAVLLVGLLGIAGIAVEVGALYSERADLQHGADSTALALAQQCSRSTALCNSATPFATATANGNALDNAANYSVSWPNGFGTSPVRVETTTRTAGGGSAILLPLASFFGLASKTVHAHAAATWAPPSSGVAALPIAIALCEFQKGQSLSGVKQLLRSDNNRAPCASTPGGFGWLAPASPGACSATFSMGTSITAESDPGNNFPDACLGAVTGLLGKTILVPIYDTSTGTGNNARYHIYGFAAFIIDGWRFSGGSNPTLPEVNTNSGYTGTLSCTGNCRGIQGRFVKWGFPGADSTPPGPNLGASGVALSE